jgi:hypothetical protein
MRVFEHFSDKMLSYKEFKDGYNGEPEYHTAYTSALMNGPRQLISMKATGCSLWLR